MSETRQASQPTNLDVVVVGAGFAGLYTLYKLREIGLTARAFDIAGDVGGVWYWNRYPGARCDVESMQYSFAFDDKLQQEWKWSELFSPQPEILKYAQHVAERFDLRKDIQFNTRIADIHYDEKAAMWDVRTDHGQRFRCRFVIMGTGCLSAARTPHFPDLETFAGTTYHTGNWPHQGVDFTGQRVGVIGTGSSGIQAIPQIAKQAEHLFVFQRTPNFSVPARNTMMKPEYEKSWKDNYAALRDKAKTDTTSGTIYEKSNRKAVETSGEEVRKEFERRWEKGGVAFMHSFTDMMIDAESNHMAADFVRGKIRSIVKDHATAESLSPKDHPIGAKRICVDTEYFQTYNRDNVTLVDLRKSPIDRVTPNGIQTREEFYELDSIVFATGYDAMTGALLKVDIAGRGGEKLAHKWQGGPVTYLGLMVVGFPNFFMITGPGSPSVLSNMIFAIEQHVDWIMDCLRHMKAKGVTTIEATAKAEEDWVEHVNEIADKTLFPRANSWYVGANVPGKARVFMPYAGGVVPYREKCNEVAKSGYDGFSLSK
jgi:cyclohexanone monooxygenase